MVCFTQVRLSKLGAERCTGDDSESNPTGLGLALNRRSSQSFTRHAKHEQRTTTRCAICYSAAVAAFRKSEYI